MKRTSAAHVNRETQRVTRCFLRQAIVALVLAGGAGAAIAGGTTVEDLVCPARTLYKRIDLEKQDAFSESCRDGQNVSQGAYRFRRLSDGSVEAEGTYIDNKKHGAERYYSADGKLLYSTTYSNDVSGEVEFTPAGWAEVARLVSEQLKRDGKQVLVSANGRGGLLVEHTTPLPRPARQSDDFSARVRREFMPMACGLLTRNPQLDSVDFLIRWSDGVVAGAERFRLVQCPPSKTPAREP